MRRFAIAGTLICVLGCSSPPSGSEDAGTRPPDDARPSETDARPSETDAAPIDTDCAIDGDGRTTLVFLNNCSRMLEMRGSDIESASIAPGATACRDIGSADEELSAKRYWGFLGDDPGPERHTLAEFTFNTDFHDFDWYNISHVDAHNLTMRITPRARPDCDTLLCDDPALLAECPDVGRYEDASGELVSCVSPSRDDPESEVALHFESCEDGYAWSGDDQRGEDRSPVRACAGEDWEIVFCP